MGKKIRLFYILPSSVKDFKIPDPDEKFLSFLKKEESSLKIEGGIMVGSFYQLSRYDICKYKERNTQKIGTTRPLIDLPFVLDNDGMEVNAFCSLATKHRLDSFLRIVNKKISDNENQRLRSHGVKIYVQHSGWNDSLREIITYIENIKKQLDKGDFECYEVTNISIGEGRKVVEIYEYPKGVKNRRVQKYVPGEIVYEYTDKNEEEKETIQTSIPKRKEKAKLTQKQVALLYHYKGMGIDSTNMNKIALDYGWESPFSGVKLKRKFKEVDNETQRTAVDGNRKTADFKIKNIKRVIEELEDDPNAKKMAESELNIVEQNKNNIEDYY